MIPKNIKAFGMHGKLFEFFSGCIKTVYTMYFSLGISSAGFSREKAAFLKVFLESRKIGYTVLVSVLAT